MVLHRVAGFLAPTYQAIRVALQMSQVVYADETGWRIRCVNAWLCVFTKSRYTFFVIAYSRGSEVATEVLGKEFSGKLVSDFLQSYNPVKAAGGKQKCLGHMLRALAEVEACQTRGAVRLPRQAKALRKVAIALKAVRGEMPEERYRELYDDLEERLDSLLAGNITKPENLRLANRMRTHRDALLTFLYDDEADATNNQAERQLRPAVLQRKVSAGNRSDKGARTHLILADIYATCRQQGVDFIQLVTEVVRAGNCHTLSLPGATTTLP